MHPKKTAFATLAIREGHHQTAEQEHSEAIFPTSSYTFASAEEAAAKFSGEISGNIYSRFCNPTVRYFEERLATLEEGESCVATSSGMSAILAAMMGLLQQGDEVVCSKSIFGTTTNLFNNHLAKFGIKFTFVDLTDLSAWEAAMSNKTRMLFAETPSNPLTQIVDIKALSELAHRNGALLVIDNCFCTPALQKPLALGADIVTHSATKYIDGQGRCIGGAVVGDKELVGNQVFGVLRSAGMTMSPFNAWIFHKGLETLDLRMRAHSQNAHALAHWLDKQESVEQVYYPGLASHPQHELAKQQQSDFGGILSFIVKGGKAAGWKVMDQCDFLSITANLGDTKTTLTHPASTTHCRLSPEERASANISDGLIRVAVGLEHIDDIINDLTKGLPA